MCNVKENITEKIQIKGLVQGVGFRPFIYKLAKKFHLSGSVINRNDCVLITVQGDIENLEAFIQAISIEKPKASSISSVTREKLNTADTFKDFIIKKSKNQSREITQISPDISLCPDCLEDMKNQPHRINYPFINCTNCGPRFSIIKDLPYDREKTTMTDFEMCDTCRKEYTNVSDRRFHAQPIACNNCGPEYSLYYQEKIINDINKIIDKVSSLIIDGKIVAIKGIGGFFIACDATNEEAVSKLRKHKIREGKPFAVMFRDMETLLEYSDINFSEKQELESWKRPVLILKTKKKLASDVSLGFNTIGAMLPYMAFHYLLFEKISLPAIVLTSGNISENPIVIDNSIALSELGKISDAVVTYNREIYNRTDDSVARCINNKVRLVRRSRGYVPNPVNLNFDVSGIIAAGAELVNCFAIGKKNEAILSQHIGDLKNAATYQFYLETIEQYRNLFRINPQYIARDLHPDYLSSRYADFSGLKQIKVQHHHAHVASCMAENGINEKVIGIAFDGTGLGTDKNIWGGEFLIADFLNFERFSHFEYIQMPGGDKVIEKPWKMAVSYLYHFFDHSFLKLNLSFLNDSKIKKQLPIIIQAIEKNINCPLTSSIGRLFDAVSALLGICSFATFHAEAPMRLENLIVSGIKDYYSFEIKNVVSLKKTFSEIIYDIKNNTSLSVISTKFHNTIIAISLEIAKRIRKKTGIKKVVLSGGSFQNKYLSENLENLLYLNEFEVFTHTWVPSNDGGIALGQLAIAAMRINNNQI